MRNGSYLHYQSNNRILLQLTINPRNMEYLIEHNNTLAKRDKVNCLSKDVAKQGNLIKKVSPPKAPDSKMKHNIEEMQAIAETHGGKCLSKKYVSVDKYLKWQCGKCDNIWYAKPANIIWNNQWCPKCGGSRRLTIEEMKAIAKDRGGKCLSKKYINARTKLKWQCGEFKHVWYAIPDSVKRGSWCPICGRRKASQIKTRKKHLSL